MNQKSVLNKVPFVLLDYIHNTTSSIQLLIITNTQHKTMMITRASSRLLSSTFGRKRYIDTIDVPADGGKKKKVTSSPTINQELKVLGTSDQFIKDVAPLMDDDMVQDVKHLLNDQPEQTIGSGGGNDLAETEEKHDEETLVKMADDDEFSAFQGMPGDDELTDTEEKNDEKTLLDEHFASLDLPVQNQYHLQKQKKEELPWKYCTELNGKKYNLEERSASNKDVPGSVSAGVGKTNIKEDEDETEAHQNKMDFEALGGDDFLPSFLDDEFDKIQSQDMMNGLISSYDWKW
jgi:hypothetical protein